MELLESLVSHLTAGVIGAAIIWWPNRTIKRQFFSMMEAIDEGKEQGKDWKLLRDETAWETFGGHRYMMTPEPGNWYDAEQYARWLGGHLVKVDDAPEQD